MTTIQQYYHALVENLRTISRHYYYEGRLADAIQMLKSGVESCIATDMDLLDQAQLWLDYGTRLTYGIFMLDYTLDTVLPALNPASEYIEQLDNQQLQGDCLTQYGRAYYYHHFEARDFTQATAYLEQARELQLAITDQRGLSESTLFLGLIQQFSDNKLDAIRLYEEAYEVGTGHALEQSYAILHLGILEQHKEQWQSSLEKLEKSLHLRQSVGFKVGLPFPHIFIGDSLVELGQHETAHAHYEQARTIAQEVTNQRALLFATLSLGIMYYDQQNSELAKPYLLEAKEIAATMGHSRGVQMAEERLDSLT